MVATKLDSENVTASRVAAIGVVAPRPALRERRAMHGFKVDADVLGPRGASDACVLCGYGEAGHLGLTGPERDVLVALVNQPKPQPLMRQSILRKLKASWRVRRGNTGTEPTNEI